MENNGNENGNGQQNGGLPDHLEELLIHERLANFVRNKVAKNLFLQWNERLCQINKSKGQRNVMFFLKLNGQNEEENKEKLDEILDALKEAEDHFYECDETERFNVKFKFTHRMLIPEQKCPFIIGTGGESIRKLREDCNLLKVYIDNGEREPLPQGYSCLIMVSDNVEGLRQARSEVCHSLRIASMDYNPRGLANGNGKRLSEDGNVKERVQFSNPKQREKWQQILEESRIEFITISNDSIELSGTPEKVMEVKERLMAALNGMVRFEIQTPQKWQSTEILVPFPNFRYVLGQNGDTIKAIQAKFDVRLIFQGENHEKYPNGRRLKIKGPNKEKVEEAKAHIEANYCVEKEGPEMGNDEQEMQKEMTLPEKVARKGHEMKIQNQLKDFDIRRALRDGSQRVVLKGTRKQLEEAEAKLEKYCEELAKNGGKCSKGEEESSKSGSEGGKPKHCWIMPGEEKENDGPEIVMNEDEEDEEEEKKKTSVDIWSECLENEKSPAEEGKKTLDVSIYDIDNDEEDEELEEKEAKEESNEDEEEEEEEDEEEDEEMKELEKLEGGKGTSASQTMLEMLSVKMDEMKEIMEVKMDEMKEIMVKALQEMKKEEYKKNEAYRRLEQHILASEFEQNGNDE